MKETKTDSKTYKNETKPKPLGRGGNEQIKNYACVKSD